MSIIYSSCPICIEKFAFLYVSVHQNKHAFDPHIYIFYRTFKVLKLIFLRYMYNYLAPRTIESVFKKQEKQHLKRINIEKKKRVTSKTRKNTKILVHRRIEN